MPEWFHLPERLATRPVSITVVGAGGTGSAVLDGLAAMTTTLTRLGHPGFEVAVFDDDTVSEANIGRQRFCAADVGQPKVTVLTHRINLFYGVQWEPRMERYDGQHSWGTHLLITCVDRASARATIGRAGHQVRDDVLWLDFGNGADRGQAVFGHWGGSASGLRLPNVFDLHPELESLPDDDTPSCSLAEAIERQTLFVGRALADHGLDLLMRLFRQGRIDRHGVYLDLASGQASPLMIDPATWAGFGYSPDSGPTTPPDPQATEGEQ